VFSAQEDILPQDLKGAVCPEIEGRLPRIEGQVVVSEVPLTEDEERVLRERSESKEGWLAFCTALGPFDVFLTQTFKPLDPIEGRDPRSQWTERSEKWVLNETAKALRAAGFARWLLVCEKHKSGAPHVHGVAGIDADVHIHAEIFQGLTKTLGYGKLSYVERGSESNIEAPLRYLLKYVTKGEGAFDIKEG